MWFQNQRSKELKQRKFKRQPWSRKAGKGKIIYVCNRSRVIEHKNQEETHNAISLVSCTVLVNKSFHYRL